MKLANVHKLPVLILLMVIRFQTAEAQTWSLHQCIDTAQVNNKNLQMSRNSISIGEERHKEAWANLIPKVNVTGDYKYFLDLPTQLMPMSAFGGPEGQFKETQFGVPHQMNAAVQLSLPIYNPQIYGAIKTTGIAREVSKLQFRKTEEEVIYEISNLYYNAQILKHQLKFLDSNIENTSKLLNNMRLMHEHLLVKASDVNKVQLQSDQLTTQRDLIASNLEQVLNALKFTMGIGINKDIAIESEVKFKNVVEYIPETTLDVQLTKLQNKLLESELKTLKNSRLPSLAAYGSYGQYGFGYDEQPNDFLEFFPTSFVGLQLSFPIFSGTVTGRKINQKEFEIENNELQLALVSDKNEMLIENAINRRSIARQNIENTLSQIALANNVYQQSVIQQKEGTASLTDVLMADNALREAQQSNISAIIDYLKADLELKKVTGNISSNN